VVNSNKKKKSKNMKKVFIGIDFSKLKFDVTLINEKIESGYSHKVFDNHMEGYKAFILWIKQQTSFDESSWLICGEHTGLYSLSLTRYLKTLGLDIWLEAALQIKRSMGIVRGKSDKADSMHIASYACRFKDKARVAKLAPAILDQVKDLLSYRNRLKLEKQALEVSRKELSRVKDNATVDFIVEDSIRQVQSLDLSLKQVELRIEQLLKEDEDMFGNYLLLQSIKGVGKVNAVMMLVLTGNFTLFASPRSFGCYCGVVPFGHGSGTSVKAKDRVSHLANKQMKVLLTQAARSAIMHNKIIKAYYTRKIEQGKDKNLIVNNVRNKLIHLMFAVVRNKQAYNIDFKHPLSGVA